MANQVSLMSWNDSVQRGQPYALTFLYKITAAKTVTSLSGTATLPAFDAYASQAVIDTFLNTPTGTTSEFLLSQFDATAMGTDSFAAIVNLNTGNGLSGQAKNVVAMIATLYSGTNGATAVSNGVVSSATLTASTQKAEVACGAYGDLAFKVVLSGVDALTSGLISVTLHFNSK